MEKTTKLNLRKTKIIQFGYVYKDIDKQAEIMRTMYNVPRFRYWNSGKPVSGKVKYRGKDSEISVKVAQSRLFNIDIELIQWISGDCPYKEFLDQGKEGLHHIMIDPEDAQSVVDDLKKKGVEVLLEVEEFKAIYLDTEESLGINIEILVR